MTKPIALNPKQTDAVNHFEGPLLILAGAGSGKTRVLVERMVHLIQNQNVSPWSILAVTFTNKAAREMKNRVVEKLGPSAQSLWISTFHSSCLRILRQHADRLGFDKQFAIYDDTDQKTVIKQIIKSMDLSDKVYKPKTIQFHINGAKNEGIGPDDFATGGDFFLEKVQAIYKAYQSELKRNQAMDFGDLINQVLRLFQNHPDVLGEYQEKFKFIMVDEYQDTNICQYLLIKLLSSKYKNICVVGDDDQSIYKFRGAEIRNILDFQKDYPDAKLIRLEQNYRSTQTILNAANAVIRGNKGRMGKELWTQNNQGDQIDVFAGATEKDEAIFLGERIDEYKMDHSLRDMAIFYRTNAQSRAIEDELRRRRIAYKIFGGIKFYDRAEIKDMMAYLQVLVNPADGISLKRILNTPARGIGKTTVDKVQAAADQYQVSFWDVVSTIDDPKWMLNINKGTKQKLATFASLIQKINQARVEMNLVEFLPYLYEQSGYWKMLTDDKSIESESRKENLNEFVNVVEEFMETNEQATLPEFLDQVSLASDVDKIEEGDQYVTLMTIHLAKGLEFPIVFLVGLEEGLFPHARSLENEDDLEEERRLCYVGMTRAEKRLHMSFVNERRIFGSPQYNFPSRFLEEIPSEFVNSVDDRAVTPSVKIRRNEQAHYGSDQSADSYHQRPRPQRSQFQNRRQQQAPTKITRKMSGSSQEIDYTYSQNNELPIKMGSVVRHQVFGDGKVVAFEGQDDKLKVSIRFKSGIQKKLLFKHAHLQILN